MFKKTMLAALAATFVFAALPAVAGATVIEVPENRAFTVSGENLALDGPTNIECSEVTGEGEFDESGVEGVSHTGTIEFTFHGCKGPFGSNCTTEGQSTGTITTTELTFHLETVTEGKPAVLITLNEGHFASFKCTIFVSIEVTGTGIIGEITAPEYEESSSTLTVGFSGEEGGQNHTTVEGDESEVEYGLEASVGHVARSGVTAA